MRKLVLIGAAVAMVSFAIPAATPALAEDVGPGAVVGGTTGAWTGGTIGFFLGGPIGAFIGGSTGAIIGGGVGSSVDRDSGDFGYDGPGYSGGAGYAIGDIVDDGIRLRRISGESAYGYFRAEGMIYVVDRDSREIVEIRRG